MQRENEPRFVLDARERLAKARQRVARQEGRVGRLRREGRDTSQADKLLKMLLRQQRRCEQYLSMVLGWWRKHKRRKFPRSLRARFLGPRSARETSDERSSRWDRDVRVFLERQYPQAPH